MRASSWALAALVIAITGNCTSLSSYVKVDDSALGRVVVYRNGIAFFQRRAHVDGDQLVLRVPADKVDDFLKSLTVKDAKSGKTWPVSFPMAKRMDNKTVEMKVQLPHKGKYDLVLSYITEAPSWKPSYRITVNDKGKVEFQGWAIVDNTSGEDWKAVRLGVGSSSALSFRFDLHSVHTVHRETLALGTRFAVAPPRGGSVLREKDQVAQVIGELKDDQIPRPDGHPQTVAASTLSATSGGSGGTLSGKRPYKVPLLAPRVQRTKPRSSTRYVRSIAQKLKNAPLNNMVYLEGYSRKGEAHGKDRAYDRANVLRNQLIAQGIAPAQLKVRVRDTADARRSGVRVVLAQAGEQPKPGDATTKSKTTADTTPVGQSHFESAATMTVARGTSAMVAVVHDSTSGEVVYLYDPESKRGHGTYAFRAVRVTNPTASTLEGGPVTVYGKGRFIGEGLTESIPPKTTAVIPFALDRQVVVSRKLSTGDRINRLITLNRGVLKSEVQHLRKHRLKISNRGDQPTTVFVRHTVQKGWDLTKNPEVFEKLGESYLFAVKLKGKQTRTVRIEEATPLERTIDLRSPVGLKLVRVYLQQSTNSPLNEPMEKLLALYAQMDQQQQAIENLHERMNEYRRRVNELHGQIFTLKAVKTGGSLMRHLKKKMKEISERLQQATIEVVGHQERLMLARIRFHDGLNELTLEKSKLARNTKKTGVAL